MKTIQEEYKEALKTFREHTVELTTKIFEDKGELTEPLVFALIIKDKKVTMGMLAGLGKLFGSELGKEAAVEVIRKLSEEVKPIALAFCCEGYASVQRRKDGETTEDFLKSGWIKPSQDPDKKEVLFFTFETFDKAAGTYLEIVRSKGNIDLKPMHDIDWEDKNQSTVGGKFTNLLQDNYSEFAMTIKEELKTSLN
jgi:hypothetical protein